MAIISLISVNGVSILLRREPTVFTVRQEIEVYVLFR